MGNTYEVHAWKKVQGSDDFQYELIYGGEDMAEAMEALFRLKAEGMPCVKFTWR